MDNVALGMCILSVGIAMCAVVLSSIGPYRLGRLHGILRARQSARNREHKRRIRQLNERYRYLLKAKEEE